MHDVSVCCGALTARDQKKKKMNAVLSYSLDEFTSVEVMCVQITQIINLHRKTHPNIPLSSSNCKERSRDGAYLNEATCEALKRSFTIYLANVSESCVYNNKLIDTSAEQLAGQTREQSIGTLCFALQTESWSGPAKFGTIFDMLILFWVIIISH